MRYTDELTNLQEQMKNYIERLNAGKLSNKDSSLMIQIAGSYYEALEEYQKLEKADDVKAAFDDILNEISTFQDSIIKGDSQEIREAFEYFSRTADKILAEAQKQELIMEIFKTDLKEMDMHEVKMRNLQSIVDFDIKLYGSVSRVTLDVLDVEHCELIEGHIVNEKYENEISEATDDKGLEMPHESISQTANIELKELSPGSILRLKLPKMEPEQKKAVEDMLFKAGARYHKYVIPAEKSHTHEEIRGRNWYVRVQDGMDLKPFLPYVEVPEKQQGKARKKEAGGPEKNDSKNVNSLEQSYQGVAYLKGTGEKQKPTVLYGNSPEDIITTLQGWNRGRTEEMQLKTCYIRKLNTATNQYDNMAKYEIDSGMDVTPIYLNLPHMSRDKFTKISAELRENGAKYNPVKKAFFVTRQLDLNKFSEYLPMVGTQSETGENRSRNELAYEVESGQEYYDNRVKITIEGMEPFNVYGDDYDVHFPSLSAESTREIIEKFVLPEIDTDKHQKIVKQEVEYNGRKYDPLQMNVLELALKQNFTQEQMMLLERPELSSDRMNEIRFAVRDGLSAEQIAQFATPSHEQWQMDLCRVGMQHGISYDELKAVISQEGYSSDKWGERRSQLSQLIKEHENTLHASLRPNLPLKSPQNKGGERESIISKLSQNKAKLEVEHSNTTATEKRERSREMEK